MKKLIYFFIVFTLCFIVSKAQKEITVSEGNKAIIKASKSVFFIENKGQWNSQVLYMTKLNGLNAWVTKKGVVYDHFTLIPDSSSSPSTFPEKLKDKHAEDNYMVKGHVVKMKFLNSQDYKKIDTNRLIDLNNHTVSKSEGIDKQETYYNYFIGNDSTKWASFVGLYKEIIVRDLYQGIDIRYYFDENNIEENGLSKSKNIPFLRYDFIVHPGADISQIKIDFEGADDISVNSDGELILKMSIGDVYHGKLFTYQIEEKNIIKNQGEIIFSKQKHVLKEIPCKYIKNPDGSFGFKAEDYDKSKALVIDPLIFSTYLGATTNQDTYGNSLIVDSNNDTYVTGTNYGGGFPTTTGAYMTTAPGTAVNIYVSKFNSSASNLLYSTYLGGISGVSRSYSIAIDAGNNAYLTGMTYSPTFPTTNNVLCRRFTGVESGFLTKFNSSGSALSYSTFISDTNNNAYNCFGIKVKVDASNNAYIFGATCQPNFPTTANVFQPTYAGGPWDYFVLKLNATASTIIYSSFLGGSNIEENNTGSGSYGDLFVWGSVTLDNTNNLILCGKTNSTDFPVTTGAYQTNYNGTSINPEAVVVKINSNATTKVFATFLGGTSDDIAVSVERDVNDNVYVLGRTYSTNFPIYPTGSVLQSNNRGDADCFITKLNSSGSALNYSTYFGGSSADWPNSLAVNSTGNAVLCGVTWSSNFRTSLNSYQTTFKGPVANIFISKLNTNGSDIDYSTFLSGTTYFSHGFCLYVDNNNNAYFSGYTRDNDFPTTSGSFQPNWPSGCNNYCYVAYLTKLELAPEPSIIINRSLGSVCPGATIKVPFTANGTYNSGNTFTAQLSSSSGSFASPTTIGTLNGTTSDSITSTIPLSATAGTGYRVRVNSSNPVITGRDTALTINTVPTVSNATGTARCLNDIINYTATGSYAGHTFRWSARGGAVQGDSTQQSANIKWTATGNDTAFCRITNPSGCSAIGSIAVLVNPLPTPTFTGDTVVCVKNVGNYTSNTLTGLSNQWEVLGGTIVGQSDQQNLQVNWKDTVFASVTLIQTNTTTLCKDSITKTITLNPLPTPSITGSTSVCEKNQSVFSVTNVAGHNYKWDVTGGTIQGVNNTNQVTINWGSSGTGTIKITESVISTGCMDSANKSITINQLPPVNIAGNPIVCENSSTIFSVPNTATYTYKWTVTGGTINGADNTNQVAINWGNSGNGTLQLIVTNTATGCKDSSTIAVQISSKPVVKITGATTVPKGTNQTYNSNSSNGITDEWTVLSGGSISGSSTDNSVSINWGAPGTGQLKLVQTNASGCKDSTTIIITITNSNITLTGVNSVCEKETSTYSTPDNSQVNNLWTVTLGTISGTNNGTSVLIKWGSSGIGNVKLVQTNKTTSFMDSADIDVTINPLPKPTIIGLKDVFENTIQVYSSPDNGVSFKWFASNGTIQGSNTGSSVKVKWNSTGNAKLELIESMASTGCKDSVTIDVTVNAAPGLNFSGNTSVCEQKEENYSSSMAANETNKWFVSGGTIKSDDKSEILTVLWGSSGTGYVRLVRENKSISYKDSIEKSVTINAKPHVTLNALKNFCEDAPKTSLTGGNPAGGKYYLNGIESTDLDPQQLKAGKHTVSYSFTNPEGCSDSTSTEMTIYPLPAQPTITESGDSLISSSPNGNQWFYQDTLIPGASGQIYVTKKEGIYTTVVTDTNGCSSKTSDRHYYPSGGSEPIIVLSSTDLKANNLICESIGYDTLYLSNVGGGNLIISKANFSGTNSDEFELLNSVPISVSSGNKEKFIVAFKPKSLGQKTATLALTNNSKNDSIQILNISAKKDSIGFILSTNKIEFKGIPANFSTYLDFTITNTGTLPVQWTLPIKIDKDFSIESINPSIIPPGGQSLGKISFGGGPDKTKYSSNYNLAENVCGHYQNIQILATIGYIAPEASATLKAGSITAKPGDIIGLPIYLDSSDSLAATKVSGFQVDLSFNPTILTPVFETPKGIIQNSQRIITLELPVNPDTKGVLKTVYLQTNLGTDTLSSLKLINQKSIGDSIGVKVIDGLLLLKGVCMEGGAPRLVNTSGSIQLELLKPNPSDNQIQINYETIESGLISLYIIDSFGKTVRIIKEGSEETGVKSMSYFIGDLASGIYYLKLKTPTSFKTQKFEVYK